MILFKILEHDLHRSKAGASSVPLLIEVPARPEFVPALVSNARGEFLVSRKLVRNKDNTGCWIRVGVFEHDPDRLDDVLAPMTSSAYELSIGEKWKNVFHGEDAAESAFAYLQKTSGFDGQPHVCVVPSSWSHVRISKFFGKDFSGTKFKKVCHVARAKVPMPVFLSRPDMVGMYTQFMGGRSSILLHNIKLGLALCPSRPSAKK